MLSDPNGGKLVVTGVENPMSEYLDVKLTPSKDGKTYGLDLVSKATEPLDFRRAPVPARPPAAPR